MLSFEHFDSHSNLAQQLHHDLATVQNALLVHAAWTSEEPGDFALAIASATAWLFPPGSFSARANRLLQRGDNVITLNTFCELWAFAKDEDERESHAFSWANMRLCWMLLKTGLPVYLEARYCYRHRTP